MSTTIADLLERNKAAAAGHTPIPTFKELRSSQAPAVKTFVVACMDPRCVPEKFFNLQVGEVAVYRNAGGNVRHAFRDIAIMEHLMGLDEIAIIHHTDCGTLGFTEDQIRAKLKAEVDEAHWPEIDGMVFGANADLEESVKADVQWVRANPLIREKLKRGCQGFIFDLKTGKVEKVDV